MTNHKSPSVPEVSILSPAYNVERYIEKCLDSVLAQTFTDWELLLVDDGSTDGTGEICDRYAALDERIKVIHQPNTGVAGARNTAVAAARGKYIAWIDPDDHADPRWLEKLHSMIVETGADVAQVGYIREYTDHIRYKSLFREEKVLSGEEAYLELLIDRKVQSYLWNKMFRREVMTCPFPVGMKFEDIYTHSDWFRNVHRMAVSGETLYYYRMRRSSIMNTAFAKARFDYLKACVYRAKQAREHIPGLFTPQRFNRFIASAGLGAAKAIARFEKDPQARLEYVERISKRLREYPLLSPEGIKLKRWWRLQLLRRSPKTFIMLMRATYKADLHQRMRKNNQFD